jgi:hypothetical protein
MYYSQRCSHFPLSSFFPPRPNSATGLSSVKRSALLVTATFLSCVCGQSMSSRSQSQGPWTHVALSFKIQLPVKRSVLYRLRYMFRHDVGCTTKVRDRPRDFWYPARLKSRSRHGRIVRSRTQPKFCYGLLEQIFTARVRLTELSYLFALSVRTCVRSGSLRDMSAFFMRRSLAETCEHMLPYASRYNCLSSVLY